MFRASVLALQEALNVAQDELALNGIVLAFLEVLAVDTRLPPACFETYMPASATRIMSSTEKP